VIAILLVALPRLLREQVEAAIDAEPDLEIVAERDDSSELEEALRSTGARVVVAGDDAWSPRERWRSSPRAAFASLP
jgi:DNA-binding NarL/FixJ family response regulator